MSLVDHFSWLYLVIILISSLYILAIPFIYEDFLHPKNPGFFRYITIASSAYLCITIITPFFIFLGILVLAIPYALFTNNSLINYASFSVLHSLLIMGCLNLFVAIFFHQKMLHKWAKHWSPSFPSHFGKRSIAFFLLLFFSAYSVVYVQLNNFRPSIISEESELSPLRKIFWVTTHSDDLVYAGTLAAFSHFFRPDDKGLKIYQQFSDGHYPQDFTVHRASFEANYIFVSDLHIQEFGNKHDHFNNWGKARKELNNMDVYLTALDYYANQEYTLVEIGDIEDLLVRAPAYNIAIIDQLFDMFLGPFGNYFDAKWEREMRVEKLQGIALNNRPMYKKIQERFLSQNRFIKVIGNHDEILRENYFQDLLNKVYDHPIQTYDYLVLVSPEEINNPQAKALAVAAHGHQFDPYCAPKGQELICDNLTASLAWLGTGADRVWPRKTTIPPGWEGKMTPEIGFDNHITYAPDFVREPGVPIKWRHMDEGRAADLIQTNPAHFPYLILGHSHEPRIDSLNKKNEKVKKYLNTGSSGLYEQLIWVVELNRGTPQMAAWYSTDEGKVVKTTMIATDDGRLIPGAKEIINPLSPSPSLSSSPGLKE